MYIHAGKGGREGGRGGSRDGGGDVSAVATGVGGKGGRGGVEEKGAALAGEKC